MMTHPLPLNRTETSALAAARLDRIREDLLNFSRRNPLVNTRLNAKSSRYLRVVDELPQVLYDNLTGGQPMHFNALPAIPDPPPDEQTDQFQEALRHDRSTDEQYAADRREYDALNPRERMRRTNPERVLMDRLRLKLGLPPRIDPLKPTLHDLRRHAMAHGIEPAFELPRPSEEYADGRHTDREIQALALPDEMRKNLEKVYDEDRRTRQEAGINSLYCAFGFLEWTDPSRGDSTSISPLILLPVSLKLDKRRQRYTVEGTTDKGELNLVLSEKLRRELRIELPSDFDGDIEAYFAAIAAAAPKTLRPTVHRYVAFGTFNSTQVAVFEDLDPEVWPLTGGPALELLISSAGAAQSNGFGDEYPLDSPEFRETTPLLIADADSSQVSTLVDKNLI
jgi:hypothetical protein